MGIIRITVRTGSHSQSFRFHKEVLVFGDGAPPNEIDVLIPELGLKPEHIKILHQGERFVVVNVANDPFVTLNGFPFGKKTLKEGDILHIRDAEVQIEALGHSDNPAETEEAAKTVSLAIEKAASEKPASPAFEDLSTLEIESFLGDVQEEPEIVLKPAAPIFTPPAKPEPSPKETFGKLSLKDDPFHESEEDPKPAAPQLKQPPSWFGRWRFVAWGIAILAVIVALITSELYLRFTTLSKEEEMHAAEGVADIAMGLTYAQIHEADPASQNWSDPEFLRHSLMAILSPNSISQSNMMSSSQSTSSPYILRIYTSYDLLRFIIVAQPMPNLMQMWVQKHAIIVDSQMMYLRKTMDFKSLNKFLAYPNPLDEAHRAEWEQILTNSSLITLAELADNTNNEEFLPPKALGFLRPGAENKIYNAPRYHEFGAAVLLHALARRDLPAVHQEDLERDDGLERLADFENLILYVPEHLYLAHNSTNLFAMTPLEGKFLFGYLNKGPDGKIKNSHLLMQNDQVWNHNVSEESPPENEISEVFEGETRFPKSPLTEELETLAQTRKEDLHEIKNKIHSELEKHIIDNNSESIRQANEFLDNYEMLAIRHNLTIQETLSLLRQKYSEISCESFNQAVHEVGLSSFDCASERDFVHEWNSELGIQSSE